MPQLRCTSQGQFFPYSVSLQCISVCQAGDGRLSPELPLAAVISCLEYPRGLSRPEFPSHPTQEHSCQLQSSGHLGSHLGTIQGKNDASKRKLSHIQSVLSYPRVVTPDTPAHHSRPCEALALGRESPALHELRVETAPTWPAVYEGPSCLPVTQCSPVPQASERCCCRPRGVARWRTEVALPHAFPCTGPVRKVQEGPLPAPLLSGSRPARSAHHIVARQQFLQELGLLVHDGLDDELIIAGDVEDGAAGTGVGQLDKRLITQRVLEGGSEDVRLEPHSSLEEMDASLATQTLMGLPSAEDCSLMVTMGTPLSFLPTPSWLLSLTPEPQQPCWPRAMMEAGPQPTAPSPLFSIKSLSSPYSREDADREGHASKPSCSRHPAGPSVRPSPTHCAEPQISQGRGASTPGFVPVPQLLAM